MIFDKLAEEVSGSPTAGHDALKVSAPSQLHHAHLMLIYQHEIRPLFKGWLAWKTYFEERPSDASGKG